MAKKICFFMVIIVSVSFCVNLLSANQKTNLSSFNVAAFPEAQGGGMYSTGARGAYNREIYHVTNLSDSGIGSLRDAVSKDGRIIIFDVGGNIKLEKSLNIDKNNITILGQTAPGDGISIDNECVKIHGSNIIIRYLRFRMGSKTKEEDTVTVLNGNNIIIDHCSMSWSIDECLSFYAVKNFTVQWCIISESLNNSIHIKGTHGMGGIWGGINVSAHHNLLASHNNRNPMVGTGATVLSYENRPDTDGLVDIRNNVIYNWGNSSAYGGQNGVRVNLIGNYYRPGPATKSSGAQRLYLLHGTEKESTSLMENGGTTGAGKGQLGWSTTLFVDKNYIEGAKEVNEDNWLGVKKAKNVGAWEDSWIKCESIESGIYVNGELKANDEYIYNYPIITQSPQKAYEEVLKYAGASIIRDNVDERVINDVINKTAPTGSKSGLGLIDSPDDVGGYPILKGGEKPLDTDNDGMPDFWEDKNGYDKNNPNDAVNIDKDGYMPIEKYCEELILPKGELKNDKTALTDEIYKALKIKKDGYTKDSWQSFSNALETAQNIAGMVYPSKEDIDNALILLKNTINSLEIDEKYDLRFLINKAESLNSLEYIKDGFDIMLNKLEKAKTVYENINSEQSEIDIVSLELKEALDNLEFNYKYLLESKIFEINKINQMDYSVDDINDLANEIEKVNNIFENNKNNNEEFKAAYEYIKNALKKLTPSNDKETRVTGDFENMACFNLSNGKYGNYTASLDEENSFFIKQGIAGNDSKALIMNDVNNKRTSFQYKPSERKKGILKFKGDYCFLSEPLTELVLFRAADSNFSGVSSNNFFDVSVIKSGQNSYLRYRNYSTGETSSNIISQKALVKNKWYTLEVTIDTIKKVCSISFDDTICENIPLYNNDIAIDRYSIETPGSNQATLAIDNISFTQIKKDYDIENFSISDEWTSMGDININTSIINYDGDENFLFITASYEGDQLIDADLQKLNINKNNKIENVSSNLKLGKNIENCKVKIFIWSETMKPYYQYIYKYKI